MSKRTIRMGIFVLLFAVLAITPIAAQENGCDPACVKIIIDGQIMSARSNYLIETLHNQEAFVKQLAASGIKLTKEEREKLLVLSQEQCDFSKLIEAQANKTAYMLSEIAKKHAGIKDDDDEEKK